MSDKTEKKQASTVAEILKMDDGDIIKAIEGRLTKIYDTRVGGDGDKKWEYQDGEFTDATGRMKIVFSKCAQDKSAKNKTLRIDAYKHDTHGWLGLKIKDSEYQGKTTRAIQVSATAKIEYAVGNGSSPETNSQSKQSGAGSSSSSGMQKHPDAILEDLIALHKACWIKAGEAYGADSKDLREIAATLFIEANKNYSLSFDAKKRLSQKNYPPPPSDPSDWDACVISSGSMEGKTLKEITDEQLKKLFDYYDGKKDNSRMAECVYQAARDRGVLEKEEIYISGIEEPDPDVLPF